MSARRIKRRRGIPKSVGKKPRKFTTNNVTELKNLLNGESKGLETLDSQSSSPSVSRVSSPFGSERISSSTLPIKKGRYRGGTGYQERGYNLDDEKRPEYRVGSDFSDVSNIGNSVFKEERSETGFDKDSDDGAYSLTSHSTTSRLKRRLAVKKQTPGSVPLLLKNKKIPPLEIPESSRDLLVPRHLVLQAVGVYEVLRHFRTLLRLSPFRFEDFCAALISGESTPLLAECHLSLLKALLREDGFQKSYFGPLDRRDLANVTSYAVCDTFPWAEVICGYVACNIWKFDRTGGLLHAMGEPTERSDENKYPCVSPEDRLKVLTFLTDQFLVTNQVRNYLLNEDVPEEDQLWSVYKECKVRGVTDCISEAEKRGLLCRQEHLGLDRHGRKYWFLVRRIFVESEDGGVWYYSSRAQLSELKRGLDAVKYEASLVRELEDLGEELERQMAITEELIQQRGGGQCSSLVLKGGAHLFKPVVRTRGDPRRNSERDPGIIVNGLGCQLYVNQYSVIAKGFLKKQQSLRKKINNGLAPILSFATESESKWIDILYTRCRDMGSTAEGLQRKILKAVAKKLLQLKKREMTTLYPGLDMHNHVI